MGTLTSELRASRSGAHVPYWRLFGRLTGIGLSPLESRFWGLLAEARDLRATGRECRRAMLASLGRADFAALQERRWAEPCTDDAPLGSSARDPDRRAARVAEYRSSAEYHRRAAWESYRAGLYAWARARACLAEARALEAELLGSKEAA